MGGYPQVCPSRIALSECLWRLQQTFCLELDGPVLYWHGGTLSSADAPVRAARNETDRSAGAEPVGWETPAGNGRSHRCVLEERVRRHEHGRDRGHRGRLEAAPL